MLKIPEWLGKSVMILWYALVHVFTLFGRFGDYTATFIREWINKTLILYKYGVVTGVDMTVMMECMNIIK